MGLNSPLVAEDTSFSWSYSRQRTYDFCQRSYYYKYYGAQQGWDKFTENEARHLYRLKNIKRAERWMEEILSQAIIKILTENRIKIEREVLAKHLCYQVIKNYNRDWMKIRSAEWKKDPKNPNIFEVYYDSDPDFLHSKQDVYTNKLLMALNCFILSPLFEELISIPFLSWKHLRHPDSFYLNELCVWCAPDLAWIDGGELKILTMKLGAPDKSSKNCRHSSICALMANSKYRFPIEKIKCFTFFFEAERPVDALKECKPENISKTLKEIEKGAAKMRSKISRDSKVYESDFPKRKCRADKYDFCEFREYCDKSGY